MEQLQKENIAMVVITTIFIIIYISLLVILLQNIKETNIYKAVLLTDSMPGKSLAVAQVPDVSPLSR